MQTYYEYTIQMDDKTSKPTVDDPTFQTDELYE